MRRYEVTLTRKLAVRVHADSYEEAERAVLATVQQPGHKLPLGSWEAVAVPTWSEDVPLRPTDYVVHQGRVVRANTIDDRTLPLPLGEEPR
jgi:hypothetical protein